jgi:hypothetical protein
VDGNLEVRPHTQTDVNEYCVMSTVSAMFYALDRVQRVRANRDRIFPLMVCFLRSLEQASYIIQGVWLHSSWRSN